MVTPASESAPATPPNNYSAKKTEFLNRRILGRIIIGRIIPTTPQPRHGNLIHHPQSLKTRRSAKHHPKQSPAKQAQRIIILQKIILPKKQSPSHTTQQLFCEKNRVPEPTHFRQKH
jgi:hypothetical protein